MTRDEFWKFRDTQHAPKVIPLATHVGISRYQEIRVAGKIVPTNAGATEPASNNLVDFDGIAMFLYQSADVLTDMLSYPYYIEIVEPDEHTLIDKSAHRSGMVATYAGEHIEVVDDSQNIWEGDRKTLAKYQRLLGTYE
ncbi:EthD domain-containing protein [Fusarium acuminatum]